LLRGGPVTDVFGIATKLLEIDMVFVLRVSRFQSLSGELMLRVFD